MTQHHNNMKAIEINGEIKQYNNLPKSWGNIIGGFNLLSDEELADYGFYDVEISEDYNESIHNLSDIYWDDSSDVFRKDSVDKTWSESLSELKEGKINSFKLEVKNLLDDTDWYITRSVERNIDIPQEIQDERAGLLNQIDTVESEVNALTTKKQVVLYEFPTI